ncbi:MAG TPA: SDR family oxidoreductase [Candidatus Saccharimonadales bacterium]|jgi:thioester reductase-like protein|nr:SDR family oxidoreductase [Candidatus Saccharimonadales bacterium]
MAIFLTGVTGAIGGELLRSLLEARTDSVIYALFRAKTVEDVASGSLLVQSKVRREDVCRVIPIAGNVELEDFGLGNKYWELTDVIREVYHVAACTSFGQTVEQARLTNVFGTENVIEFARAVRTAGNPIRLHHISTAYVSGTRTGFVREDELEEGQEFFNYYEWSKFEAERAVQRASLDVPITVYRPGIVVGDSRTGHTSKFHGIYQVMKGIHFGLLDSLPCQPDFVLDLSPVDYVCRAIVQLASLIETVNKTFHLTAGPGNTVTLSDLIEIYFRERAAFAGTSDRSKSFKFSQPEEPRVAFTVDSSEISTLFAHYSPYFSCPKVFDNKMTRAALRDLECPRFSEYLPGAISYALKVGFRPPSVKLPKSVAKLTFT